MDAYLGADLSPKARQRRHLTDLLNKRIENLLAVADLLEAAGERGCAGLLRGLIGDLDESIGALLALLDGR